MGKEVKRNQYYHWWLLFWPVFLLRYCLLERWLIRGEYHVVYSVLDDRIPFREEFLIPYVLWYVLFVGMHLYTFCRDVQVFRAYSRYLAVTISISTLIYILYPTCQNLRPWVLPRDNLLTAGVALLYRVDTSTNVCPSEHVIGAVGAFLAAVHTKALGHSWRMIPIGAVALLSGLATVFLKQHSVLDVLAALAVSAAGWYFSFRRSPSL